MQKIFRNNIRHNPSWFCNFKRTYQRRNKQVVAGIQDSAFKKRVAVEPGVPCQRNIWRIPYYNLRLSGQFYFGKQGSP